MPADTGEAGEVVVVGVNDSAVFDCNGCDDDVGDEFAGGPGVRPKLLEEVPMPVTGVQHAYVRQAEPRLNDLRGFKKGCGPRMDFGASDETQEGIDRYRGDTDQFR